jgi:hypothetical protein
MGTQASRILGASGRYLQFKQSDPIALAEWGYFLWTIQTGFWPRPMVHVGGNGPARPAMRAGLSLIWIRIGERDGSETSFPI